MKLFILVTFCNQMTFVKIKINIDAYFVTHKALNK